MPRKTDPPLRDEPGPAIDRMVDDVALALVATDADGTVALPRRTVASLLVRIYQARDAVNGIAAVLGNGMDGCHERALRLARDCAEGREPADPWVRVTVDPGSLPPAGEWVRGWYAIGGADDLQFDEGLWRSADGELHAAELVLAWRREAGPGWLRDANRRGRPQAVVPVTR